MALPKLEANRYSCVLPICKKKVEYRPFLVKEQKVLLIAAESEESVQANSAMIDMIKSCVYDEKEIDLDHVPMMDLEYLFIQIRIKSAGETADIGIPCTECEEVNQIEVDLRESKLEGELPNPKLELTETIGITLTYPSVNSIPEDSNPENTEDVFKMIGSCVETIYDGDEVFTRDDFNEKELMNFLDQFSVDQFEQLNNWFLEMPRFEQKINFVCSKCEASQERLLQGVSDFFE
tara:strand:- start:578 stop:1282 length:705 start_codon:yes stop_codon:yes gene_type:complete